MNGSASLIIGNDIEATKRQLAEIFDRSCRELTPASRALANESYWQGLLGGIAAMQADAERGKREAKQRERDAHYRG